MALNRPVRRYDSRGRLPETAGSSTTAAAAPAAASLRSEAVGHQRWDQIKQTGTVRSGFSATPPIIKNENRSSSQQKKKESSTFPCLASSYRLLDVKMMLGFSCLSLPPAVHCGVFHHKGTCVHKMCKFCITEILSETYYISLTTKHFAIWIMYWLKTYLAAKRSVMWRQVRLWLCQQAQLYLNIIIYFKRATTFKFEILTFFMK